MKALFNVFVEKVKEIEANYVGLGLGVLFLIFGIMAASIICNFFDMIREVVTVIATGTVG